MNRTSFFSSCSFLIPLRSASWPPKRSCTDLISGETFNGSTAATGFMLSVELSSKGEPQPLFFRETDPAMTPIQFCSCDNRRSFYVRIGSDVYLLDTRSIQNRSSVVEAVYEDPENTDRKATFPPCLILHMGNVSFRIFRNRLGDCGEDFASLQKMEQSLAAAQPPARFFVPHDDVASPCRISIGSSQHNDSSSTELLLPDKERKRSADEELQQRCEKRRTHFHDFRATANRLSQVLQQPVTKPTNPNCLTPLLSRLADTAAASFILQEEVDALNDASGQQNSTQVQQLLDQFFPSRNRRKSQLQETPTTTPNKHMGPDFSLERMEAALQEQEESAKAKYEILMLPRRG